MVSVSSLQSAFKNVSVKEAIEYFLRVREEKAAQLGLGVMGSRMVKAGERGGFEFDGQELNPQDVIDAREDFIKWDGNAVKYRAYPGLDNARDFLRDDIDPIYPEAHDYSKHLFVIEALPEDLDKKIKILKPIIEKLPEDAVIAINTSSLPIEKIAEQFKNPERFVGIHFFKPADRNDVVEIIKTKYTSDKTLLFAYNYIKSMGKTPVVCLKDTPGGFANKIIDGVMNEQSKIVAEGKASRDFVDEVFMEVFYRDQYQIQFPKVQQTFKEEIPKLNFFEDEKGKYSEIRDIDTRLQKIKDRRQTLKYGQEIDALVKNKKELLETILERLGQKVLYCQIAKNIGNHEAGAGTFYAPPENINAIQEAAAKQFKFVKAYVDKKNFEEPLNIQSFEVSDNVYSSLNPFKPKGFNDREYISKRLMGAYIGIAQKIVKDELASVHDVEAASIAAFRYNVGPNGLARELVQKHGEDYVEELISYANPNGELTGIIKPEELSLPSDEELSGIQVYVQDDVAHIVMGRYHVQNMQIMMNSLHSDMIKAMIKAVNDFNNDPNINAIVIESQGSNEGKGIFCSGADLNQIRDKGWDYKFMTEYVQLGQELMTTILESKKPITAIADGTATGGGLELLAAVANNGHVFVTTRFSGAAPECALGIFPAWLLPKTLSKLSGKELTLSFIANSKGLTPGGWTWIDDATSMKLGISSNKERITTSDLPEFTAKLLSGEYVGVVNGKEQVIDIRKKPDKIPQFNKHLTDTNGEANFPAEMVRKLRMKENRDGDVVYSSRWRLLTRFPTKVAEIKVMYSDDPQKEEEALRQLADRGRIGKWLFGPLTKEQLEEKILQKVVNRGWLVSNLYIKPFEAYAKSKTAQNTVKTLGATLQGTLWAAKNLAIKPVTWATKAGLKVGVGLPLRIAYDAWHYFTKPTVYELGKDVVPGNLNENKIKENES